MQRQLWSVQYLRAIAAFSIVIFHRLEAGEHFDRIFRVGTDIFFVTSGFMVWSVTAGQSMGPVEFVIRRLSRIAPLYWILTLVTFLAATIRPAFPEHVTGSSAAEFDYRI